MTASKSHQEVTTKKLQYTPEEAAARLDLSLARIEAALQEGELEAIETADGEPRLSRNHLKEWLRNCDEPLPEEL